MSTSPLPPDDDAALDEDIVKRVHDDYRSSRNHSAGWREKAREDYAMTAGSQWVHDDKAALAEQLRPCVTFNRIGPVIDAVSGSEVSNRQEVQFLPRKLGDAGKDELLSSAAKWVRDECDAEDEESDAFIDVATCGMGWTETRLDVEDNPDGEIRIDRLDPLDCYWDPAASKRNLSDARWVMRLDRISRADLEAMFPDAELPEDDGGPWAGDADEDDEGAEHDADRARLYEHNATGDYERSRGKLTVAQYQCWERRPFYRVADPLSGQLTEFPAEKFETLSQRLKSKGIEPPQAARFTKRWYRQVFVCGNVVLSDKALPVQSGFTLNCITGKRDRNHNTWYGLVRPMKDPQRWANKFFSTTLHHIQTSGKGILAEEDAFANPRKAERDWARADSITFLNKGAVAKEKIMPKPSTPLSPETADLMQFAVSSIRDVTGVNLELLGLADREQAGVLEAQRKQAGLTILAGLFDSLRRYRKRQGRVMLSFIQEYISDGRLIRIAGADGGAQYLPLIRDPQIAEYDVVVDDVSTSPNQKERVFAILMQLLPVVSKMGMPLTPDMMDYLPLPASLIGKWKQTVQQRQQQGPPPNPAMVKAMGDQQYRQGKLRLDTARTMADIEGVRAAALVNLAKAGALQNGADLDRFNAILDAISGQADQQHSQALDVADMAHGQAIDRADLALRQQQAATQQQQPENET